MLGLFGTLNMASQSMQAQMIGVEVAGQNLANVNTPGYSRQIAQIAASPDIQTSIGPEGTGAQATSIQQAVSSLLNSQIQSQNSTGGYWNSQQTALQNAQDALDEFLSGSSASSTSSTSDSTSTTGTGLSGQLNNFFSAFSALASSDSQSNQQAAVAAGQTLATSFNSLDSQFASVRSSLNTSLTSDVGSANQLLTNIAGLNQQIYNAQTDGGNANDLLDEREQDLENLSGLTSISTSTGTNGAVNVTIGGQTLVSGDAVSDTLQTYDAGNGQLLVQTATGGVNLTLTGGSIQGTIDARDGTLATMQNSVNTLAGTLITQVNGIQDSGYNSTGGTGNSFFTGTDAGTISVNAALTNNPSLIQISGSPTNSTDTSLALQISQLATASQSALSNQTFGDSYDSTVDDLGTALGNANNQVTNQTAVATMLSTQRSSVSGVNVDEEMTNLMTFQRAYQASAEVVTTVNTMLGDLLGMVTT
ncbi:MAG: flagellar hook-associated protein FlgK [Verrucomicrobiota bacterium]|jgi:flagellar hook-associated protein 1 FlgK